jgi:hypothetical protein
MDWRVTIAAQLNADPTIQAIFGGKEDPITQRHEQRERR